MNNQQEFVRALRKTSLYLDSVHFVNAPEGTAIFEPVLGQEYELRHWYDVRDQHGQWMQLQPGERLLLRRVEPGCAHFEVRRPKQLTA
jgi:hypothetical protein